MRFIYFFDLAVEFHRSKVCRGGVDLQDPCPLTVPGVDVEPARQSWPQIYLVLLCQCFVTPTFGGYYVSPSQERTPQTKGAWGGFLQFVIVKRGERLVPYVITVWSLEASTHRSNPTWSSGATDWELKSEPNITSEWLPRLVWIFQTRIRFYLLYLLSDYLYPLIIVTDGQEQNLVVVIVVFVSKATSIFSQWSLIWLDQAEHYCEGGGSCY